MGVDAHARDRLHGFDRPGRPSADIFGSMLAGIGMFRRRRLMALEDSRSPEDDRSLGCARWCRGSWVRSRSPRGGRFPQEHVHRSDAKRDEKHQDVCRRHT
jgi:hypothetical protein